MLQNVTWTVKRVSYTLLTHPTNPNPNLNQNPKRASVERASARHEPRDPAPRDCQSANGEPAGRNICSATTGRNLSKYGHLRFGKQRHPQKATFMPSFGFEVLPAKNMFATQNVRRVNTRATSPRLSKTDHYKPSFARLIW
jgi:hypothetical protein